MSGEVRLPLDAYNEMRDEVRKAREDRAKTRALVEALDSFFNSIVEIEEVQKEMGIFNANQTSMRFVPKDGRVRVSFLKDA